MYKKRRNGGTGNMRNGYTPPPGYDGSRFVRNRDRVTVIGDGDYTLSVGGIPRSGYREDQKLRSDMRDDAGARRTRGGYRTPHRSTSGSSEEECAVRDADAARSEQVGAPGHGGGNAPTVPDGTDSAGACAVCRDADAAPSCGGKCAELLQEILAPDRFSRIGQRVDTRALAQLAKALFRIAAALQILIDLEDQAFNSLVVSSGAEQIQRFRDLRIVALICLLKRLRQSALL